MKKDLSRLEEIQLLTELSKNDTYFAQIFKPETVTKMIQNITNDFVITCDTGIIVFNKEEKILLQKIVNQYFSTMNKLNEIDSVFQTTEFSEHLRTVQTLLNKIINNC